MCVFMYDIKSVIILLNMYYCIVWVGGACSMRNLDSAILSEYENLPLAIVQCAFLQNVRPKYQGHI